MTALSTPRPSTATRRALESCVPTPCKTPRFEPKQRASESKQAIKPESAPRLRTNRRAIHPEATAENAQSSFARLPITQTPDNQTPIENA